MFFFPQAREITILPLCLFLTEPLPFFIIFLLLSCGPRTEKAGCSDAAGARRQKLSVRRGRRVHGTEAWLDAFKKHSADPFLSVVNEAAVTGEFGW